MPTSKILLAVLTALEQGTMGELTMGRVASVAGISRQGLYLHFSSRRDLALAALRFVDEHYDIDAYLQPLLVASSGAELLDAMAEFQGRFHERLYLIARYLHAQRASDEIMELAWQDRLAARRNGARLAMQRLADWRVLRPEWTVESAGDWVASACTTRTYEDLVLSMGWSLDRMIEVHAKMYRETLLVSS